MSTVAPTKVCNLAWISSVHTHGTMVGKCVSTWSRHGGPPVQISARYLLCARRQAAASTVSWAASRSRMSSKGCQAADRECTSWIHSTRCTVSLAAYVADHGTAPSSPYGDYPTDIVNHPQ